MTDKVELIVKKIERMLQDILSLKIDSDYYNAQVIAYEELLDFINSLQEEPVSIWHDGCEIPKSGINILMIRKDEEDSNYPPIAGCFHGTNYRLDGKNWGYYNGFCYNEIEPPVRWAYIDDILNLSKVERTGKNWKEEPVSEEWIEELRTKLDSMSKEDFKKVFEKYAIDFNKELVSEELCDAANDYGLNIRKGYPRVMDETDRYIYNAFKAGAQWQKEQFENNRLKHCNSITNEQAELEQGFIDQHLDKHQRIPTFLDAIEYGMQLQKEHMLKDATEFTFDRSLPAVIDCRLRAMDIQYGDRLIIIKSDKVL